MASAPSITALVSDPLSTSSPNEVSQQENGDNHQAKAADDSTLTEPTETKSNEEPAAANGTSKESLPETKPEQSNTGEKQELEVTSIPEPSSEKATEPESKKQRTNDKPTDAANGSSAPARPEKREPSQAAPEKKKGGRPKKTKETVKKDISTDGIGSRTRSRTKVVS